MTWRIASGEREGMGCRHRGQGNVLDCKELWTASEEMAKAWNCIGVIDTGHVPVLEGNCASTAHQGRGSVSMAHRER